MNQTATKTYRDTIEVNRSEYRRLKEFERKFKYFLNFAEQASDIKDAREELKRGEGIGQDELFKELGI